MRTNSSGLSGVNARRFQKPFFLLTRTWRCKSELSSLMPQVNPLLPLKTEGRTSISRISRAGMTMVWRRIHDCSSSRSEKIRYSCHKLAPVRRETKSGCSKVFMPNIGVEPGALPIYGAETCSKGFKFLNRFDLVLNSIFREFGFGFR